MSDDQEELAVAEDNAIRDWLKDSEKAIEKLSRSKSATAESLKSELAFNAYPMLISLAKILSSWVQAIDDDLTALSEAVESEDVSEEPDPEEEQLNNTIKEYVAKTADLALYISLNDAIKKDSDLTARIAWIAETSKKIMEELADDGNGAGESEESTEEPVVDAGSDGAKSGGRRERGNRNVGSSAVAEAPTGATAKESGDASTSTSSVSNASS